MADNQFKSNFIDGPSDNFLYGWGRDNYGQLGDSTVTDKSSPVQTITGGTNWKQIACGYYHTTAIKTDGTLWAWGNNTYGNLGDSTITANKSSPVQTIAGGTNWSQVAGGYKHTTAIKTDGTLWTWGYNGYGQLGDSTVAQRSSPVQTITGGTNWSQVACGYRHTTAIKTDGTLWTWGSNWNGQLGDNTVADKSSPVQTITGGTNWKQVAGGSYHTTAIKTDGTLWTWGSNTYGQLGNNTTTQRNSPVQTIAGGTNWSQVAGGYNHIAAIKTDGTLWAWGYNYTGMLGDGTLTQRSSPIQTIAGGTNWKQVASGSSYHAAAIKTDGTLWTWGRNIYGGLGDNTQTDHISPAQTITGGTNWSQVSCGYNFTSAIVEAKTDVGTKYVTKEYLMNVYPYLTDIGSVKFAGLWTWGRNQYGQLGDSTITAKSSPVQTVAGGTNWKQVAVGQYHATVIKTDGTLWSWGYNSNGQLGDNTITDRSSPVQTITGGTNWKQVACGQLHTTAIKTDGTLWSWGRNDYGQLSDSTLITRSSPVQTIAGGTNWKQVSAGNNTSTAIKTDGTLWSWGWNNSGQLGDSTTATKSSPVQTITGGTNWKQVTSGPDHTLAIKTDGTLWAWGYNVSGLLGDSTISHRSSPVQTITGGTNWKQVSGGYYHTTAIKTDGTLWNWGQNTYGQLSDNTRTDRSSPVQTITGGTNWSKVAGGYYHTTAIKTDGTLWTWGRDNYGQLGDNTRTSKSSPVQTITGGTNWKQVACGYYHTLAIQENGDDF